MNSKTIIAIILLVFVSMALTAPLWAQTEADFQVTLTQDGQGVRILRYTGTVMDVVIPATIQGMPVREIAPETFRLANDRRMDITSVVIPEGVIRIENDLFGSQGSGNRPSAIRFERLASVTLPSTITHIGEGAFDSTTALRSITLPEGLVSIDRFAFRHSGITSITFPTSLNIIGAWAFADTTALRSVTLPESMERIGHYAFQNSGITSVTLPANVQDIGSNAFQGSGLTSVTWPGGVARIGWSMFADCRNLHTVIIPEGVTYIGPAAFAGCTALTTVTIPDTVERIEFGDPNRSVPSHAFEGSSRIPLATQALLRRLGYTGAF